MFDPRRFCPLIRLVPLATATSMLLAACNEAEVLDVDASAPQPEFCAELPRPGWAAFARHSASNDWFEVYQLADDLFAIAEPYQWQEVISYLIIGDDRALLFDTGNGIGDIKAVVDQLTDLPVTVLGSHSHIDHVGGHWHFDDVLAPETDFTADRARGRDNEFVREEVSAVALCRPLPVGVTEANHHIKPFKPTGRIADGSLIDLGTTVLEVLTVPGHTPDSVALLDRAGARVFTGDTYYRGPIWLFAPETDLSAYRASIARLAALVTELTTVYGGHNEPVSDPEELVKVRDGLEAVLAGDKTPTEVSDARAVYEFETFDLLLPTSVVEGKQ